MTMKTIVGLATVAKYHSIIIVIVVIIIDVPPNVMRLNMARKACIV